jgi:hypothetical protein
VEDGGAGSCAEVGDDGAVPVDDGAEDVEEECVHAEEGHREAVRSLAWA